MSSAASEQADVVIPFHKLISSRVFGYCLLNGLNDLCWPSRPRRRAIEGWEEVVTESQRKGTELCIKVVYCCQLRCRWGMKKNNMVILN